MTTHQNQELKQVWISQMSIEERHELLSLSGPRPNVENRIASKWPREITAEICKPYDAPVEIIKPHMNSL
jgi:hypothetical protein